MAFYRTYECPDCGGRFRFLHHPNDLPPPDRCELCHSWMAETPEPVFEAQAPRIGTLAGKSHDNVYRAMEKASEDRMELMAEAAGGSASDYKHTKITDMGDSLYPGDTAAKYNPPPNYVQEFMKLNQGGAQPMGGGYAPMSGGTGAEYAAAAHQGSFPHAGLATRERIASTHAQIARQVEFAGRINK